MTDTTSSDVRRTVHARVPKISDIEIHVSGIETSSGKFVDIREFVVSLEQYGRGLTFPLERDSLDDVILGLERMLDPA